MGVWVRGGCVCGGGGGGGWVGNGCVCVGGGWVCVCVGGGWVCVGGDGCTSVWGEDHQEHVACTRLLDTAPGYTQVPVEETYLVVSGGEGRVAGCRAEENG